MDTKALEKFCPWARNHLKDAVDLRCKKYGLTDDLRTAIPADSDVVDGTVLTSAEKRQRAELYARIEEHGYKHFLEEMAYTWFNRFVAIRYMELHDYLPSRVRMLSCAADGSFRPDCLRVASELELPGLEKARVLDLMDAADDEGLFRLILLAQCNELADALPEVFGHLGAADELVLPDGLLRMGNDDVIYHLVTDIPEETWQDVEVLGWMYQFYNSERKDEFFKAKRKASADDLAPATQLFTPKWIVQYLVENSLGRLWMLNNPSSHLKDQMKYFIEPDDEHEDFIHIDGPEDITFCDPACGSGHILSYAFELLYAMYEERGYRSSEIPELILEKNLTGFEIDERAAQIASLVLAMRAREHDRRFLKRDVTARIHVFQSVDCEGASLPKSVSEQLEHLGEIGSLVKLIEKDLDSIHALAQEAGASLLGSKLAESLRAIEPALCAISDRYDVVVANPPYMGSSSFNPFMSSWIKKNYPDVKSDLCTCFIERGFKLAHRQSYSAMVTMASWMFLGSFERLRNRVIDRKGIISLLYMGHMVMRVAFNTSATVFFNSETCIKGAYTRVDQRDVIDETIGPLEFPADSHGFYRADASTFHDIPGAPIAYWVGIGLLSAFRNGARFESIAHPKVGMQTSNNDRYLRLWWESDFGMSPQDRKWIKYLKGGPYRKWYGNLSWVLLYKDNPSWILEQAHARVLPESMLEKPKVTWTDLTSGNNSFRIAPIDTFYDISGHCYFPTEADQHYLLAFSNSSVFAHCLALFNSTMHCQVGDVAQVPFLSPSESKFGAVSYLSKTQIKLSKEDWDSRETSWDYRRNQLV